MSEIWKYSLDMGDYQNLTMPRGGKIISAGFDARNELCLWAIVNPLLPKHVRVIRIVGTGNLFDNYDMWKFIGTVVNAPFVWHVFEFYIEGSEV